MTTEPSKVITTCKIIATYVGPRPVRVKKSKQLGKQNLATSELVIELLENVWELEQVIDPGHPMDTYLICNDGYPDEHKEFFRQIDGARTFGGTMHVKTRNNIGLSFGAYAFAFQELHHKYSCWLFAEDDTIQTRSGYLPIYHEAITSGNVGFIATAGISEYYGHTYANGGCGFTTGEILDRVAIQNDNTLPYCKIKPTINVGHLGNPTFDRELFRDAGEIPLTSSIVKCGYNIKSIPTHTDSYFEWNNNRY